MRLFLFVHKPETKHLYDMEMQDELAARSDIKKALAEKLSTLPASPGVYQFRNACGRVIYVGKA